MNPITRESLMPLEAYARERREFRERVLAHKKPRTVHLGEHVTLLFEDELTIRYQIQEMLRIEKVFEEAGIRDELEAYNPLVYQTTGLKISPVFSALKMLWLQRNRQDIWNRTHKLIGVR